MEGRSLLIVDTETTGFPSRAQPYTHITARMVSIAYQFYKPKKIGKGWKLIKEAYHIIKPVGFSIPYTARAIHGIGNKHALEYGKDLKTVLEELYKCIKNEEDITMVAHNIRFDKRILVTEASKAGLEDLKTLIEEYPTYCTMIESKPVVKAKNILGSLKFPNLREAHHYFTKKGFAQHHALADTRACARVLFALQKALVT